MDQRIPPKVGESCTLSEDHTRERVAMPIQVLGKRVNYPIRAKCNGTGCHWSSQCRIHDNLRPCGMSNLGNSAQIRQSQNRIAWRLRPQQACVWTNCRLHGVQIREICDGHLYTESG